MKYPKVGDNFNIHICKRRLDLRKGQTVLLTECGDCAASITFEGGIRLFHKGHWGAASIEIVAKVIGHECEHIGIGQLIHMWASSCYDRVCKDAVIHIR